MTIWRVLTICASIGFLTSCSEDPFKWTVHAEGLLVDGVPVNSVYVRSFPSFDQAQTEVFEVASTGSTLPKLRLVPGERCRRCAAEGWTSEELNVRVVGDTIRVDSGMCLGEHGTCVFAP